MDSYVGAPTPPGEAVYPPHVALHGQNVWLVPLTAAHAPALYRHLGGEDNLWRWRYMVHEGFATYRDCKAAVAAWSASRDALFYAVLSDPAPDGEAQGIMSYMFVAPAHRRVEIGSVILGERLRRSRRATEALYLLIAHAFDELGYMRVQWGANRLNAPSLAAAERLGFTFEGILRKHMIVKGRQRDTAYLSMTDDEWPAVKRGFTMWLDDVNFDDKGLQRKTLRECRDGPGKDN